MVAVLPPRKKLLPHLAARHVAKSRGATSLNSKVKVAYTLNFKLIFDPL